MAEAGEKGEVVGGMMKWNITNQKKETGWAQHSFTSLKYTYKEEYCVMKCWRKLLH